QDTWLIRVGEEGDRWFCRNQDQVLEIGEHLDCLINDVGDTGEGDSTSASLHPRVEMLTDQLATSLCRNLPSKFESPAPHRSASKNERRSRALSQCPSGTLDRLVPNCGADGRRIWDRVTDRVSPGNVGRDDQGCDLARRPTCRCNGGCAVLGDARGALRGADPVGIWLSDGFNVGTER